MNKSFGYGDSWFTGINFLPQPNKLYFQTTQLLCSTSKFLQNTLYCTVKRGHLEDELVFVSPAVPVAVWEDLVVEILHHLTLVLQLLKLVERNLKQNEDLI